MSCLSLPVAAAAGGQDDRAREDVGVSVSGRERRGPSVLAWRELDEGVMRQRRARPRFSRA